MTSTIATVDVEKIHEIFKDIQKEYPRYNKRFQYFLAACHHIDPYFDLDLALKFRPHGGLIGIDDSKLDKYLNHNKVLRLHAILHDATGFMYEISAKGPGYVYVLPCPISSEYMGHVTGISFCLFIMARNAYLINSRSYFSLV